MKTHLEVTAFADRRRAGIQFRARQPKLLVVEDLNEDQVKALEADPILKLKQVDGPADDENELTEAERANAIAEYVKSLPDDEKAKGNPPSVKTAKEAIGWKPSGEEMKNAWTALKAAQE